ncbi:MAG: DUF4190 domain-containing protein [Hungatella sp.]
MENYNNGYDNGNIEPNPNPEPTPVSPRKELNGLALGSMIVSILGLLACCLPPLQFFLGVVGILLAIFSKRGTGKPLSGFAIAGLVMSILSIVISILLAIYFVIVMGMMSDPNYAPMFHDINNIMQQYQNALPIQ